MIILELGNIFIRRKKAVATDRDRSQIDRASDRCSHHWLLRLPYHH